MEKKPALTERERRTEDILKNELSGSKYVVRANMRLADVIKTNDQEFQKICKYHLDFCICDENANVILAIELDDQTHDTIEGRNRDKNKNEWLEKANIELIRIRQPTEALNIRRLMGLPEKQVIRETNNKSNQSPPKPFSKPKSGIAIYLITIAAIISIILIIFKIMTSQVQSTVNRNQQAPIKSTTTQNLPNPPTKLPNQNIQQNTSLTAQRQAEQEAQKQRLLAEREAIANQLRAKEKAWEKSYKKPEECENTATMQAMIECANHEIRAKKQFEDQWEKTQKTTL